MRSVVYRSTIYKAGVVVAGLNQSQNDTDRSDWETNYKASAKAVDQYIVGETMPVAVVSFTALKALVAGDVTFADVHYTESAERYDINLLLPVAQGAFLTDDLGGPLSIFEEQNGELVLRVLDVGGGTGEPPDDDGTGGKSGFKKPCQ